MITERRCVLTINKRDRMSLLKRFEAIVEISSLDEVERVWSLNKTPVMLCSAEESRKLHQENQGKYDVIEVPYIVYDRFIDMFENWAHAQGFECGEYITGEKYPVDKGDCVFCRIMDEAEDCESTFQYNAKTKKEMNMVIYESPNFLVLPERGSLKPGFVMIIPKDHQYFSIAQMPEELSDEYQEVCDDIEIILSNSFRNKKVIFFEHGSGRAGYTSHPKSIVHAHTHVVVDFELDQKYLDMVQMKPIKDIRDASDSHYFAYKVGSRGERYITMDPEVYVQRQFPRQVMALELSLTPEMYNWRFFDFDEHISSTLFRVHCFLNGSSPTISDRIAERTEAFVEAYHLRRKKDFERTFRDLYDDDDDDSDDYALNPDTD